MGSKRGCTSELTIRTALQSRRLLRANSIISCLNGIDNLPPSASGSPGLRESRHQSAIENRAHRGALPTNTPAPLASFSRDSSRESHRPPAPGSWEYRTRRPLTVMWPWLTNCRAWARDKPKPSRCTTLSNRRSSKLIKRLAGVAFAFDGPFEVAAKLPFQHAVVVLHLLLFAQVDAVVGQLATAVLAMPGGDSRRSMAHLGVSQRVPLRKSFSPSRRHNRQTGPVVRAINFGCSI